MDISTTMTVLTVLMGVAVTILLAAIPWAIIVEGRLSRIEAQNDIAALVVNTVNVSGRIAGLETRVAVIESQARNM